jgi:hypothetical protein
MSGFLLDTNIPSELTRQKSAPQVERWLDEANDEELFFSVISLGKFSKASPFCRRASTTPVYGNGSTAPCGHGLKAASCR